MTFFLQASNPVALQPARLAARGLSSAVSRVFSAVTEDAVLTWNYVPILLSYKYELSVMMPEVLDMLEACRAAPDGEQLVRFGSDSFRAHWRLRWSAGELTLRGSWSCARGTYEDLLNSRPEITLPREDFLAEWKAVLERIVRAIDAAGVQLVEGDDRLDRLRTLEAGLPRYGRRYAVNDALLGDVPKTE